MNVYLISDTHFNHNKIETYCDRPENFTELVIKNWQRTVKPQDIVIHVGDVYIDKVNGWDAIWPLLPGRKWLVRGNHDKHHGNLWWCEHGFDACVDALVFRNAWITHKPASFLPRRCDINIHGHLHNIWHGFHKNEPDTEKITKSGKLKNKWQRLFALEYTNYAPVEFEKFVSHPDRYQATGPKKLISVDIESTSGPYIYPDQAVGRVGAPPDLRHPALQNSENPAGIRGVNDFNAIQKHEKKL